jgi:ParB-like chromosome segregation protein Spo0J
MMLPLKALNVASLGGGKAAADVVTQHLRATALTGESRPGALETALAGAGLLPGGRVSNTTRGIMRMLPKIEEAGGATLTRAGTHFRGSGYSVGRRARPIADVGSATPEQIERVIRNLKPGENIGMWVDEGKLWVEGSRNFNSIDDAIRAAQRQKQKAIFDHDAMESIYINKPEKVTGGAAIRDPKTGKVYAGYSHRQVLEQAPSAAVRQRLATELRKDGPNVGFNTSWGRFLDRAGADRALGNTGSNRLVAEQLRMQPNKRVGNRGALGRETEGTTGDVPLEKIVTSTTSFNTALANVLKGSGSKTSAPVGLWQLEDGRLLLVDGQHRFAEAIRAGKKTIPAEIRGQGYTDYWASPAKGKEYPVPARNRTEVGAENVLNARGKNYAATARRLGTQQPNLHSGEFGGLGTRAQARQLHDYLLPEERTLLQGGRDRTARFEEAIPHLLPAEAHASAARMGAATRGFYSDAAPAIRAHTDEPERFAQLVAATSPRTSVQENVASASSIWNAFKRTGSVEDAVRALPAKKSGDPRQLMSSYGPNVRRALTTETPQALDVLSGPKVQRFAQNLMGNEQPVTLDGWMAAIQGWSPLRLRGRSLAAGGKREAGPEYLAYSARVRQAAEKLGITPAEAQAAEWGFGKALVEEAMPGYPRINPEAKTAKPGQFYDYLWSLGNEAYSRNPSVAALLGQRGAGLAGPLPGDIDPKHLKRIARNLERFTRGQYGY